MKKQTYNKKTILSLILGILAIPSGFIGWVGMYLVGTIVSVYGPFALSLFASITSIVVAVIGFKEIKLDQKKGRSVGISGIVLSILNILLLIYYHSSY